MSPHFYTGILLSLDNLGTHGLVRSLKLSSLLQCSICVQRNLVLLTADVECAFICFMASEEVTRKFILCSICPRKQRLKQMLYITYIGLLVVARVLNNKLTNGVGESTFFKSGEQPYAFCSSRWHRVKPFVTRCARFNVECSTAGLLRLRI